MKLKEFFLFILIVAFSCSRETLFPESNSSMETKASIAFDSQEQDYSITETDITNYLKFKTLLSSNKGEEVIIKSIIPFYSKSSSPLCYIVNYSEGWELIPSDKRAPYVLASSPVGNIDPQKIPRELYSWIDSIAEKISALKQYKEKTDIHEQNMNFWKAVSSEQEFVNSIFDHQVQTRVHGNPDIGPIIPGHWELVNSWTGWDIIENIPHLTQTNWHQDSPYNLYSPLRNNNYPGRAPAGCLAIAGAQLLYYYHYKNGNPEYAPSHGTVSGIVNGGVHQSFWGESSTIWDSMIAVPDSASYLIGSIGKAVHMHYGNFVSQAHMDSLITSVMDSLSISSTGYSSYNKSAVIQSLRSGNPVLIRAGVNTSSNDYGHIFLIDYYRKFQRYTTFEYVYVYDIDPEEMQPISPTRIEYEYHDTFSDWIGMNWGLGGDYNQQVYSDDDSWTVASQQYNYNKRMFIFNN